MEMAPDEVLARQYCDPSLADELAAWCGGQVERGVTPDGQLFVTVRVPTCKGPRPAVVGDWIVCRADGTVRVMPPLDFLARHVPA